MYCSLHSYRWVRYWSRKIHLWLPRKVKRIYEPLPDPNVWRLRLQNQLKRQSSILSDHDFERLVVETEGILVVTWEPCAKKLQWCQQESSIHIIFLPSKQIRYGFKTTEFDFSLPTFMLSKIVNTNIKVLSKVPLFLPYYLSLLIAISLFFGRISCYTASSPFHPWSLRYTLCLHR